MASTLAQVAKRHPLAYWPFPAAKRVGDTIFLGAQVCLRPVAMDGTIERPNENAIALETHKVFQALASALQAQGATMSDLIKLHTYYVYAADGIEVTKYWERMTEIRLQYLADPGPAATALRVSALLAAGALIGIDGIADLSTERQRIMPARAWNWSMPTTFSQGWLIGDKIYVGGQISADRAGRAMAPGELIPQTRNTLEFIQHILRDAGAGWDDVVSIKVAYRCAADQDGARSALNQILKEIRRIFPARLPTLVAFGVDLLYEGLLLEIDATAVRGGKNTVVAPAGAISWAGTEEYFPPAVRAGNELHIGGQGAPGGASLASQIEATMGRIGEILADVDASFSDLVKLNVYYVSHGNQDDRNRDVATLIDTLEAFLIENQTVVSIVEVPGLMRPGQRVQIDGLAILGQNLLTPPKPWHEADRRG